MDQTGIDIPQLLDIGRRFVTDFLEGAINNLNDLQQKLGSAICAFAKRQDSWFRRMERRGTTIHWIDGADSAAARAIVNEHSFGR